MKRTAFLFLCFALFLISSGASCKKRETTTATGEPSRNAYRSDYYDAATAGPGYPGRSEIRVYLNKEPIVSPAPSSLTFPSRWEVCRDAIELYRPILAECGKTIVYVDSPTGDPARGVPPADCVIPKWIPFDGGQAAYTDPPRTTPDGTRVPGTVSFNIAKYGEWENDYDRLFRHAGHEFGHSLGIGKHSDNPGDMMHSPSRVSRLSERDLNTIRKVLK